MICKTGVKAFGIRTELLFALYIADGVYKDVTNKEVTITSLNDGRHSRTSLHYAGCAADLRINDVDSNLWETLRKDIAKRLTNEYDVILESDHIHLEFQPKGE